jgi:hypothetical protein
LTGFASPLRSAKDSALKGGSGFGRHRGVSRAIPPGQDGPGFPHESMNHVSLVGVVNHITRTADRFWAVVVPSERAGVPAAYVPVVAFRGKEESEASFAARFGGITNGAIVELAGRLTTSQEKDRAGVAVNHPLTGKSFSRMEVYANTIAVIPAAATPQRDAAASAGAARKAGGAPAADFGHLPPPPFDYPKPPFAGGR